MNNPAVGVASPQPADDSWKFVTTKPPQPKKGVLYIGNLSPDITNERLITFVERRASFLKIAPPQVYSAKIFRTEGRATETIGARIVIPAAQISTLNDRTFWPRPTYSRQWVFKEEHGPAVQPNDERPSNVAAVSEQAAAEASK